MKRNGWGLRTELFIILFFLMCLVIAIIGLNKMGLIDGANSIINDNVKTNTDETYMLLEQRLVVSAKDYVNYYYGGEYINDSITVRYSSLYYNNYIEKITDNNNRDCSGYVIVKKVDSNLIYSPYLKCPGYRTSGYESSKDW